MPAHSTRLRLLTATTVALAALTLTACEDGEGLRDEGPSSTTPTSTPPPTHRTTPPAGDPAGPTPPTSPATAPSARP
jgi:hypothetical protein